MEKLTVQAIVNNLTPVTEFIDAQLEGMGCPLKAQMQIDVAIDELFSNVAYYAYENDAGDVTVTIDLDESSRTVIISLMDAGKPFNPLDKEDPDVTASAEDRDIGGLGIFLVKKTMDLVTYSYEDGMNILTIHKCI